MSQTHQHFNPDNQTQSVETLEKKAYHTPELRDYGTVRELTSSAALQPGTDPSTPVIPAFYGAP